MAVQTDKLQLIVGVDTQDGIRNMGYLTAEYYRLLEAQKKTTSYTEQQNLNNAIGVLKDKIAEARKEYGLAALNAKELSQYQKELVSERNRYAAGTDQYKELNIEIEKVSQHIKNIRANTEGAEQEQALLRAQLQQTIQDYGTEALSIEQLKRLQAILYDEMIRGAKSGNLANSEQAKSYQLVAAAVSRAEAQVSKATAVEKTNISTIQATVKANGIKALSLDQLRQYHRSLTEEIEQAADFEGELNKKRIKEAQEVKAAIGDRETSIKGVGSFFENMKGQFPAALIGGLAGGVAGVITDKIGQVFSAIRAQIDEGIKYLKEKTRDISDIQTTLNVDTFSATKIYSDLGKIDTERSRKELKELVLVAGDLNVAQKDVIGFVTASDKLEKVFSRDFGGVGQASTEIAKLKDTFKETRDLKIEDAFNKIGSAIKILNEAGPASTKGITEFLSRIGQLPDAIKPAIKDAAALGAVFEEANLTAEISSGGLSNILITASQNADEFGKFMKMSKKDFLDFLTTDPTGFLTKFAEKFKNLRDVDKGEMFKTLKIQSQESIKVVGVLSDNLDKFVVKAGQSGEGLAKGARIGKIFEVFNNDGAAEIAKAEKKFETFTNSVSGYLGTLGKSLLVGFAQLLPDTTSKVEQLSKKFEEQQKHATALEKDYKPLLERIDELKGKSNLSKEEQIELRKAIDEVASGMPSAVTQWDKYSKAIDINTAAARKNIIEQRELARKDKEETIKALEESIKKKEQEIRNNQQSLNYIQEQIRKYGNEKNRPGYERQIAELRAQNPVLQEDLTQGKRRLNELKYGYTYVEPPPTQKTTTDTVTPVSTPDDKKAEDAARKREEQYRKEIDLLAELTFKRDQFLADDEDKKVLAAERQAQIQEERIRKEIKDEVRRKEALELNEKELVTAVTTIRNDSQKKREKQIADQAAKAIEIAQRTALYEKQVAVAAAEASGDGFQIYNAKYALNEQLKAQELASLSAKYVKEQELLKGNAEALKLAEKNNKAEILAIDAKYVSETDKLLIALLKSTKEKKEKELEIWKKTSLEKAKLDVQEAEQTPGGNVLGAKLALLDAEMKAELDSANLTELEKTNIVRKYSLERSNLERSSIQQIAQEALQLFGQAFSGVTAIFSQQLQNRENQENDSYNKKVEQLEKEKERGIITDKEYKDRKTATEKAHDKEVRKLRYEQARIEKASNITQATISGILAVMKAYEQAGPFGGIVGALIMGTISALQIGKIAAQPLPSLFKGGPTPDYVEKPVDSLGGFLAINHPGEYMVPKFVRQSPVFAAIEPMLESIRLRGRSFYDGGPTSGSAVAPATAANPFAAIGQRDAQLVDVLTRLNDKLDNLQVYFGGYDFERIRQAIQDNESQNNEALISND